MGVIYFTIFLVVGVPIIGLILRLSMSKSAEDESRSDYREEDYDDMGFLKRKPINKKKYFIAAGGALVVLFVIIGVVVNSSNKDNISQPVSSTGTTTSRSHEENMESLVNDIEYVKSEMDAKRVINGNGFTLVVPYGWYSKDTNEIYDYLFSYSPSSVMKNFKQYKSANNVVNIGIISTNMGETDDESMSDLHYHQYASEKIHYFSEIIEAIDTMYVEDTYTSEEMTFNGYPAYAIKFSCPNDIASVDLTNAKYRTDENGITFIENYDSLPTVINYDVPCWTTIYFLQSNNWFIMFEIIVPQESEEDMLADTEELISSFTLTESES